MWSLLILDPMVNALLFLYNMLGNNYVAALFVLTVFIRAITFPLTQRQLSSSKRMQELQPELEKLKKKHGGDQEAMAAKQMELFREHGVNPLGGCLPTLIQFPILIGLYQAITQTLAASPLQLLDLSQHVYATLPNLADLVPLQSRFLWLDLAGPDPFYILPVLVAVTTFLQQKLLTTAGADPQQAAMTQSMQITMPLLLGFWALTFPAGLSIYWIVSSVIGIGQYAAIGRVAFVNRLLGREASDDSKTRSRRKGQRKQK